MLPWLNRRGATQLRIQHSYLPLGQKRTSLGYCILPRSGEVKHPGFYQLGHTFEEFKALWTVIPALQSESAREGLILQETRKRWNH